MKTTIVTAGDHGYWGMLNDLLDSIAACRKAAPTLDGIDLCVLDVGLEPAERKKLEETGQIARIVAPGWDLDFPTRGECKTWYQAMTARPHLPLHLPEYERYLWLDADLWVQTPRAFELLLLASQADTLAIVPEIHHCYEHMYARGTAVGDHMKWQYVKAFGEAGARYANFPVFNSGVFAAKRDLPVWETWSARLRRALQNYAGRTTEQCALNAAIYDRDVSFYPLPAWCNWISSRATPMLDMETRMLFEPSLPHEPLSLVHLCDYKDRVVDVPCSDGTTRRTAITWSAIKGAGNG